MTTIAARERKRVYNLSWQKQARAKRWRALAAIKVQSGCVDCGYNNNPVALDGRGAGSRLPGGHLDEGTREGGLMGVYWRCPECDGVSSWDDFGPEEDDRCNTCGALLRPWKYANEDQREEERFNDREEHTFQRDWNLPLSGTGNLSC